MTFTTIKGTLHWATKFLKQNGISTDANISVLMFYLSDKSHANPELQALSQIGSTLLSGDNRTRQSLSDSGRLIRCLLTAD